MLDITVLAPENAGIASIASLKGELAAAIEEAAKGSSITLDLSGATRADSSLAQVVIAFEAAAAAKGLRAKVKGAEGELSALSLTASDFISRPDELAKRRAAGPAGGRS